MLRDILTDSLDGVGADDVVVRYEKFGFVKGYFKVHSGKQVVYFPLFLFPDKEECEEEYAIFIETCKSAGLDKYFCLDNMNSVTADYISAIFRFTDSNCFLMSGKKKPHEANNNNIFMKELKHVIEKFVEPVYTKVKESTGKEPIVGCFYDEKENVFIVMDEDDADFEDFQSKFEDMRMNNFKQGVDNAIR